MKPGVMHTQDLYFSGPVALQVSAPTAEVRERVAALLGMARVAWSEPHVRIVVRLHPLGVETKRAAGNFLRTKEMQVDRVGAELMASCRSSAWGFSQAACSQWDFYLPERGVSDNESSIVEFFDDSLGECLELVLTIGWRQAGWVPVHAAAVVQGERCAILSAPSQGGKTTCTVALLHLGWKTLGDDKLLLRWSAEQGAELGALQHSLHLNPQTRRWFPEVGDLTRLPTHSVWTNKRRVPIASVYRDSILTCARPTHFVQIERFADARPARVQTLDAAQTLSGLLRQTVMPTERAAAKQILSVIAPAANRLRGLRLELGNNAYDDPATLKMLEGMLE